MGERFGYARVSTVAQEEARQIKALLDAGIARSKIFIDKASGKDFVRHEYIAMKERTLRNGDTVCFLSLDRLGRNVDELKREWQWFKDMGIQVEIIDFPLLSTSNSINQNSDTQFVADIVFTVLAHIAQRERKAILERCNQGREIAKQKGVRFGRPPVELPSGFIELVMDWKAGRRKLSVCEQESGLKHSTFIKYANKVLAEVEGSQH